MTLLITLIAAVIITIVWYFTPATADMINDSFLGICVIALGTVVWLGTMLISDPEGVVKKALTEKKL